LLSVVVDGADPGINGATRGTVVVANVRSVIMVIVGVVATVVRLLVDVVIKLPGHVATNGIGRYRNDLTSIDSSHIITAPVSEQKFFFDKSFRDNTLASFFFPLNRVDMVLSTFCRHATQADTLKAWLRSISYLRPQPMTCWAEDVVTCYVIKSLYMILLLASSSSAPQMAAHPSEYLILLCSVLAVACCA
jgi:hypothetical protein